MKEEFRTWPETRSDPRQKQEAQEHYEAQSRIVAAVLAGDRRLDTLLAEMRRLGESALYLSGTRLDNEHCLGSNDLGLAVSVLPEDGEKAADPGYHPGSTEVYVVFQGSLIMESLQEGRLHTENCGQFSVRVIPPGQCHRVRHEPERPAASLIVKTNLHHKPGVVRCRECTHFPRPEECPLHRSWRQEQGGGK